MAHMMVLLTDRKLLTLEGSAKNKKASIIFKEL